MDEKKFDEKKLSIRVYNVGLGDCIYIYVPHPDPAKAGKNHACHILIDCGTASPGKDITKNALSNLKGLLPVDAAGKSLLNLLIISHAHDDHYSGFDPLGGKNPWYADFAVDRLWMSKLMDPNNPYAQKAREIGQVASLEVARLMALGASGSSMGLQVNPALMATVKALNDKEDARKKICAALVGQVAAGQAEYLDVEANPPSLSLFPGYPGAARFQVLSPVKEIDQAYLGKNLIQAFALYNSIHQGVGSTSGPLAAARPSERATDLYQVIVEGADAGQKLSLEDLTISNSDFNQLYNRMVGNALAFAMSAGDLYNITGLALLLEWKGKRLLFPGDIEYTPPQSKSKDRGAWNVIWDRHLAGKKLQYVDFFKVGHHGSDNATPWSELEKNKGINQILDALVQDPKKVIAGEKERLCTIVVSTERIKSYQRTIPYAPLMKELGRRATNRFKNYDEYEGFYRPRLEEDKKRNKWPPGKDYLSLYALSSVSKNVDQPQRTDLYVQEPGPKETYSDEFKLECASYIEFSFGEE